MKVLFLDVDGVLNSHKFLYRGDGRCDKEWINMLDPAACARLERVLSETGAVVVLSSSWRAHFTAKQFEELIRPLVPSARVVDRTRNGYGETDARVVVTSSERGFQIQEWLNDCPREVTAFAIVDDSSDMVHLSEKLVQTTWADGLLDEHVTRLVEMLSPRPSGAP